jgi:hypothetical protein
MPLGCFFFCCGLCLFDLLIYLPASKFLFQTNKLKDRKREVESPIPHPTPATPNVLHDTGRRGRGRARASAKVNYFFRAEDLGTLRMRDNDTRRGDMKNGNGVIGLVEGGATSPPWSTRPPVPTSPQTTQILLGFVCPQGASGGFDGG